MPTVLHVRLAVILALLLTSLPGHAVDEDAGVALPTPAAIGTAAIRLELIGRGLLPTCRVLVTNPGPERLQFQRRWVYELAPQAALADRSLAAGLPLADETRPFALAGMPFPTAALIRLSLAPVRIFRGGPIDGPITVGAGRTWGHDHLLDLRQARAPAGIAFVRLVLADGSLRSDWQRCVLPDVPELPLVRFGGEARRLGDIPFARAARGAQAVIFTAVAETRGWPFTRQLVLVAEDPLAATLPRLLLDGKSLHVVPDGVAVRFAATGIADGRVADDAEVVAVDF